MLVPRYQKTVPDYFQATQSCYPNTVILSPQNFINPTLYSYFFIDLATQNKIQKQYYSPFPSMQFAMQKIKICIYHILNASYVHGILLSGFPFIIAFNPHKIQQALSFPRFHFPRFQLPMVHRGLEADDPPSDLSSQGQEQHNVMITVSTSLTLLQLIALSFYHFT